LFT
jgi:hypothetical protein